MAVKKYKTREKRTTNELTFVNDPALLLQPSESEHAWQSAPSQKLEMSATHPRITESKSSLKIFHSSLDQTHLFH